MRIVPGLLVAGALLALLAPSRHPADPGGPGRQVGADVAIPAPTRTPPAERPPARRAERREQHRDRVDDVVADCGLAVHGECGEAGCVAVARSPDLDSPWGWLTVGLGHPTFALVAAGRDVGLPTALLPCRAAIDALAAHGTMTVELADGTEVWCAPDSGDERAGAQIRATCDQAAVRSFGPGATGFVAAGAKIRVLRL